MNIAVTEIRIYPSNKEGSQVIETTVSGDRNLLMNMLITTTKHYDRLKQSYIFKIEGETPEPYYRFNLTREEKIIYSRIVSFLN